MDSLTDLDEEERFFGSYDAERGNQAPLEFEPEAPPPTQEELAHLARFRRPVALGVATLALFSFVALESHGPPRPRRELVAHYGAALAAPTTKGAVGQSAPSEPVMDIFSRTDSTVANDFTWLPPPMCLRDVKP